MGPRRLEWRDSKTWAQALVAVVLLLGLFYFGSRVDSHYPLSQWLIWDLLKLAGYVALLSLACLSTGVRVLDQVLKIRGMGELERCVCAVALGVLVFVLTMYAGGALGWYNSLFALGLPLVMSGIGIGPAARLLATLAGELRARVAASWLSRAIHLYGAACLLLLYLQTMTPESLNYDATWYHVGIAQDYAREGRIVPFPADYNRAVPHLASLLYTWCYLVVGLEVPLKWMLILHCEFGLFLWTLVGVVAALRWAVADPRLRGGWVVVFLFPLLFVYDSNFGGSADHVLAFFAPPLLLAGRRVWDDFSPAPSALFSVLAGAAALTKYQAIYLILAFLPALGVRWLWLLKARYRERGFVGVRWLLAAPWAMLLSAAVVFSPHWIKNFVFYKNPVYPFLSDIFLGTTPTVPGAAFYFEHVFQDGRWIPQGDFWQRLTHAAGLLFTFSFEPHYTFGHHLPWFGSLFTLLLFTLPLVRSARLAFSASVAVTALLLWGYTFNVDRNLQTFLPFLLVVTGGLIIEIWRMGTLPRLALAPLVALQVVWGASAMLFGSKARLNAAFTLLESGLEGRAATRYDGYRAVYRSIAKALPQDAKLLLHSHHVNLGIDRPVYVDWTGYQGLIRYDHIETAAELLDYYRSLGITHVLYIPRERPASSLQEELVFNALVLRTKTGQQAFSPYRLLSLPESIPEGEQPYRALTLGMPGYADGLYPIDRLSVIEYLPAHLRRYPAPAAPAPDTVRRLELLKQADAVFMGQAFSKEAELRPELGRFERAISYPGQFSLYVKRP